MDPAWFEKVLYPFQDEALSLAARVETGFYLTGGTALGRIHLRHRYSEDLDLFGATEDDWRLVRWIPPPPPAGDFLRDLRALGEDLLLVR